MNSPLHTSPNSSMVLPIPDRTPKSVRKSVKESSSSLCQLYVPSSCGNMGLQSTASALHKPNRLQCPVPICLTICPYQYPPQLSKVINVHPGTGPGSQETRTSSVGQLSPDIQIRQPQSLSASPLHYPPLPRQRNNLPQLLEKRQEPT
jgi:hypothetical protein